MLMRTHRAIWLGLVAVALDLISFFLLGYGATLKTLQIMVLGIAVAAMAAWTPAALNAIRRGASSAADKIVMAIWMCWTVLTIQRIYTFFVVLWDRPDWLVYSAASSLITTLIIVAGTYATFATTSDSAIPRQDRTWTMISVFIGGLAAGSLATYALIFGLPV